MDPLFLALAIIVPDNKSSKSTKVSYFIMHAILKFYSNVAMVTVTSIVNSVLVIAMSIFLCNSCCYGDIYAMTVCMNYDLDIPCLQLVLKLTDNAWN